MSDVPFRLAVMQNLTALLETITPDNGYIHDLRDSVFRGRNVFGDRDPVPMVVILDSPQPGDVVPSGTTNAANYQTGMPLIVQGFVKDDLQNPSDPAYLLMADVRRCLALEKKTRGARPPNLLGMGGKVTALEIGQGTVRPPEQGLSVKAFFWQVVYLGIVEDMSDPYGWDKQN